MNVEDPENAVRRTLSEYCALVDAGAFDPWSQLFTSTAVLKGNGDVIAIGRDAILRWVAEAVPSRAGGKHVTVNSIIQVSGGVAAVSSDFIFLKPSVEGPVFAAAGKYADKLVPDHGRWRFAEREILMPQDWIRVSAFTASST